MECGSSKRSNRVAQFTRDSEWLAASREHVHCRALANQDVHEARTRLQEVLAIVEHQKYLRFMERLCQRIWHRPIGAFSDAKYRGDSVRHQRRVGERRQLDKPDAVAILIDQEASRLDCESGFA